MFVNGFGDFDTHEGLAERHPVLLAELDQAIDTFFTVLEQAGAAERAVLMTTSEFGRRPGENGSGTDHGTAAAHFVIGPAVLGGRYGEPPSLTTLDDHGNLVATVDLRSLYADRAAGLARRRGRSDRRGRLRPAALVRLNLRRLPAARPWAVASGRP